MVCKSHCRKDIVASILLQHLMTVSVSKLKVILLATVGNLLTALPSTEKLSKEVV